MVQTKKSSHTGIIIAGIICIAALISLICNRLLLISNAGDHAVSVSWAFFLVLAFAGVLLTCLAGLIYLHGLYANTVSLVVDLRRLTSGQGKNEAVLTQISENLLLSDAIKSVAFREKDRDVLQGAIRQDIRKEQWELADLLIDELETRFGCRNEAQQLRDEMESYRNASAQEKIASSIKNIESLWIIHHYEEAQNEVETLIRLYPDNEQVCALAGQTEGRRNQNKKELLDRWDKAAQNNDVDQGVEILKLLDGYLSPSEAAALEESARDVFRAKLHNMGVRFSLFVTEQKWSQALKIGSQIVQEYPNSRMAQEVREKLDILKKRAQE